MTIEVATHWGNFHGWYYICGTPGYLWPDGIWRTCCWRSEAEGGGHGYYPTREEAKALITNLNPHSPKIVERWVDDRYVRRPLVEERGNHEEPF